MTDTTRGRRETGQASWRPYGFALLLSLAALLGACGGGGGASSSAGPTSSDLSYAQQAALGATLDLSTNWVTLSWRSSVPGASRYDIEQQNGDGSWAVVDGVWATQASDQSQLHWTAPVTGTSVLRVVAVMSGYTVPISTGSTPGSAGQSQQITVAVPSPTPAIAVDQPEPLQGVVGVSIDNLGSGSTYSYIYYSLDVPQSGANGPNFDFSAVTTGAHTLYAELGAGGSLTLLLSRTVQVHTSTAAVAVTANSGPEGVDFFALATSDAGIVSVSVSNHNGSDETSLGTLTQPNACWPAPCAAAQAFNAYHFFVSAANGTAAIYVEVEATDAAGQTASALSYVDVPTGAATLDSPTNNTLVQGSLPISGTFSSSTPGALEVMVTLSGVPVYDTTVANPGSAVPFTTNVSLAGIANGIHTVDVYSRVGSADYVLLASAFVMVTGASP